MRPPLRRRCAFTLVELLVSVSITILIVVALGTMFTSIGATASRANQRTDAFRDARAALQMMTRDLSNVVRTQWDPDPFTNPPPPTQPAPRTLPVAYLSLRNLYNDPVATNQQAYGLIAIKNVSPGDLCAVGYYCSWDGKAYSLRRFFRNAADTYTTLAGQSTYVPDNVLFKPAPTGNNADDILAQYVFNMRTIAYDRTGAPMTYPYTCDASGASAAVPPAVLEISFSAISPQAARTVIAVSTSPNDWDPAGNSSIYRTLIKPNAYQFRTRIEL